tara:strand:+ start:4792 stop:5205 length:414 start_codon:yes stop_codon:yes gene_type:complete
MRSLYEVMNKKANIVKENDNFLSDMQSLFTDKFQGIRNIPELPVEASKSEWEEVSDFYKTVLSKRFSFEKHKHLRYFVLEALKESDIMMHHPLLEVGSDYVKVELYTHNINEISEMDLKLAKFIDEVYEDIKFIQEF